MLLCRECINSAGSGFPHARVVYTTDSSVPTRMAGIYTCTGEGYFISYHNYIIMMNIFIN